MIAHLEHRGQRAIDGRHARCGCKRVFAAFQRRNTLLEHGHGRVAIAGIDELILAAFDEPCFGGFCVFVNKPLGQKDRFADFVVLAAARAAVNGLGAFVPAVVHLVIPFHASRRKAQNKKPNAAKRKGAFILTF